MRHGVILTGTCSHVHPIRVRNAHEFAHYDVRILEYKIHEDEALYLGFALRFVLTLLIINLILFLTKINLFTKS